jgi:enoyl-[acyl-carrier-protein] reductase (NADH)
MISIPKRKNTIPDAPTVGVGIAQKPPTIIENRYSTMNRLGITMALNLSSYSFLIGLYMRASDRMLTAKCNMLACINW